MFTNKNIFITGAAGGIGRQLCEKFLKKSANVFGIDYDEKSLEELRTHLKKDGLNLQTIVCDLSDKDAIATMITKITQEHKIHFWLNNAGIAIAKPVHEISIEEYERVFNINFYAPLNITHSLIPKMESQGFGSIVNVGSIAGHVASAWMSSYVASKHALVGLTRSMALDLELTASVVKLVLVSPGFVKTNMISAAGSGRDFPSWLSWALSSPEKVADEIISGLEKGSKEITPTLNGKLMKFGSRFSYRRLAKSSKYLLSNSLKDALLGKPPKK